jgi:hypothetical protein
MEMQHAIRKSIDTAIVALSARASTDYVKPDDAMKLTQSALNLAHTLQVLTQAAVTVKMNGL